MRYRLTLDVERTTRTPDARSDRPRFFTKRRWENDVTLEGDEVLMVRLLRMKADEIERSQRPTELKR